jgi:hypothetical protein
MAPQGNPLSPIGQHLGQSDPPTAGADDSNGFAHAENGPHETKLQIKCLENDKIGRGY